MSTALRALMMRRDLDESRAALAQQERERDALQVREGELAEAIEAAESEEERDAVEQAVASFEQDRDETESAIQALAEKIAQLEAQLAELEDKQQKEPAKKPDEDLSRGGRMTMTVRDQHSYLEREDV